MAEAGYPEVDLDFWFGLVAPAGTQKATVDILREAFAGALANPAIKNQMVELGVQALTSTPAEFASLIATDRTRLLKILRAAGIEAK
jgi:tripartite-type tricarboxylate transporter receptor subunit TctC